MARQITAVSESFEADLDGVLSEVTARLFAREPTTHVYSTDFVRGNETVNLQLVESGNRSALLEYKLREDLVSTLNIALIGEETFDRFDVGSACVYLRDRAGFDVKTPG